MSKLIIYHHNDQDGQCAAAVVRFWALSSERVMRRKWHDSELIFVEMSRYDVPLPVEPMPEDCVVIVDYSVAPEVMTRLIITVGLASVLWIDHHASALKRYESYPYEVPGVRYEGKYGACRLAWEYLACENKPTGQVPIYQLRPHYVPYAVKLISDRDTFAFDYGEIACWQLFYGLSSYDCSPASSIWISLLGMDETSLMIDSLAKLMEDGKAVWRYKQIADAERIKNKAYLAELQGHQAVAMNAGRGSQQFGDLFGKYPLAIVYTHYGDGFEVSLYSPKDSEGGVAVECDKIAESFGGGGHPGAAGFRCKELPFKKTGDVQW